MSLPVGKLISAAPAIAPNGGPGQLAFGVAFACLVAPHSVLILFSGLTGSSGNSLVTGAFLAIATVAVALLLAAIAAGLLARYNQARLFAGYAIERSPGEIGLEKPPSCYLTVNSRNSIIVAAAGWLFPLARYGDASRFVLCSLALVVLLSLAHGRISRDGVLFALLGCAVGLKETSRAPTPARSAVVA